MDPHRRTVFAPLVPLLAGSLLLLLPLASAGCHRSGSSSAPVLASTTIGPEGGALTVASGTQNGLVLTVPPGALAARTDIRVVADYEVPPPLMATSEAPTPGRPLRIEPQSTQFAIPATLRLPYLPQYVAETGPGNVRVRQVSPFATRDHEPAMVDAIAGRVQIDVRTLGRFQVVTGPRTANVDDYLPALGAVADLGGGFSFAIEAVPPTSPYAPDGRQWRIRGPGVDERLVFVGRQIVARESDLPSWRERWSVPVDPFASVELVPNGAAVPTQVEQPLGSGLATAGLITVTGWRRFAEPRTFDGRLVLDVLRLAIDLAWDRQDIGVGQRQYVFWFAPGDGLLAFAQDGVVRERRPE